MTDPVPPQPQPNGRIAPTTPARPPREGTRPAEARFDDLLHAFSWSASLPTGAGASVPTASAFNADGFFQPGGSSAANDIKPASPAGTMPARPLPPALENRLPGEAMAAPRLAAGRDAPAALRAAVSKAVAEWRQAMAATPAAATVPTAASQRPLPPAVSTVAGLGLTEGIDPLAAAQPTGGSPPMGARKTTFQLALVEGQVRVVGQVDALNDEEEHRLVRAIAEMLGDHGLPLGQVTINGHALVARPARS